MTYLSPSEKKSPISSSPLATYSSPTRKHLQYPYILLQQETSSKNISSSPPRTHSLIATYSSPTRRHLQEIILPQEDISHFHTAYNISQEQTYRVQRHRTSSIDIQVPNPKKSRFSSYRKIEGWPLCCEIPSSLILFQCFRTHFRIMIFTCSEILKTGRDEAKYILK